MISHCAVIVLHTHNPNEIFFSHFSFHPEIVQTILARPAIHSCMFNKPKNGKKDPIEFELLHSSEPSPNSIQQQLILMILSHVTFINRNHTRDLLFLKFLYEKSKTQIWN